MRRTSRLLLLLAVGAVALLVSAPGAAADHATRDHTPNMRALGHSLDFGSFLLPEGQRDANSDLAFWGNLVFNGDYDGFRIIRGGPNPEEISRTRCNGDQGDIVVWRDILVRAWNTKRPEPRRCDNSIVQPNFEGVHIFDIGNIRDPELIGELRLPCGSHTLTVAGISGGNLIVYSNNSSGAGCDGGPANGDFMDVIAVPLRDPGAASLIHREPLEGPLNPAVTPGCHDVGVIRGRSNLAVCASADFTNVFDIGRNSRPGGSLEDPEFMFGISEPGVDGLQGRWHSAALTWDGEVIILDWEPGGGAAPECEAQDPPVKKSLFFYDADDATDDGTPAGTKLGQWVLPRPQSSAENCTIHNYNILPLRSGRYIVAGGHYQAGTWVVEFTNPAAPVTLGWSDPPPLVPPQLGGAWSSYWYNGLIYESEITKGLMVFRYTGRETRGEIRLDRLNPQTQEFTIRPDDKDGRDDDDDDDRGNGRDDDDDDDRGNGRDDDDDHDDDRGKGRGRGDDDDDDDRDDDDRDDD
jgi:hypothetical protein